MKRKIVVILSGMFLSLILLEAGMRIAGYTYLRLQEQANSNKLKTKDTYTILCLGESTTAGQYPQLLEDELNRRNIGIKFSVANKGRIGIGSDFIVAKLQEDIDKYKPDMVITMMGINDNRDDILYEKGGRTSFIKSLKIYKLMRLLKLHIRSTIYNNIEVNSAEKRYNYQNINTFEDAEKMFKKELIIDAKKKSAYFGLGAIYQNMRKYTEAIDTYNKFIKIDPKDEQSYLELVKIYMHIGRYKEAEELCKKALNINPMNQRLYANLANIYILSKKTNNLEELLEKAVEPEFKDDVTYRVLYELSKKYCKKEVSDRYLDKINKFESNSYYINTKTNYNKLVDILIRNGVKYVCVQYPVRSLRSIEKILDSKEGIVFVDNEKIFRDAVDKEGYNEFFQDRFAGDFGHCTEKGNRLLAGNIADTIIKEVFNR